MRLLDLSCGAGGAAMGYSRAGFDEIVGVDNRPMPRYPFAFVQADALEYVREHGHEFDAIHASPPCQRYSSISTVHGCGETHPDLVAATRLALEAVGCSWVIENVVRSPVRKMLLLCGSSFGLQAVCHDGITRQLRRHRWFESSELILGQPCQHRGEPIGVYGHGGGQFKTVWQGGDNRGYMGSRQERRHAMGIDWMSHGELTEAIPPAYTEFIGRQLLPGVAPRA